ncbi:hypothetical protein Purlil1_10946 [Purpureocillium lilacinum]|uniref:Calmodulin n=1 Tax=Purpureocillium lilacinum TaxID=33203 RepID=A0ABR0BL25_PURLI|nr:hypothetical protein Purlil1_10946 [Purpureocillium lilacinum]
MHRRVRTYSARESSYGEVGTVHHHHHRLNATTSLTFRPHDPVTSTRALTTPRHHQPAHSSHMPPKRKPAAASASASGSASKAPRQSKLAKEHNISAQEEGEIKEAWGLFAEPMDGEKNGVLPIDDVKSALMCVFLDRLPPLCPFYPMAMPAPSASPQLLSDALGIPPSSRAELAEFRSILDPSSDGYATYEPFFAICALKLHARSDAEDDDAHRAAVDEAFRLFTNGDADGLITLAHLRRVAAVLKEDVDEELLKDMILEANGGTGVARGVRVDEFDEVMRNAGVWR